MKKFLATLFLVASILTWPLVSLADEESPPTNGVEVPYDEESPPTNG
ncbi:MULTISPECIES: hypothetical protein [Halobacillus]|nr:hypothetical protein [Halobacillus litoralis]